MVLTVYAFIEFTWTQQHSTQNTENWKIKTIMFLQSAMLFAEMSYLTDERCFGEARGIMPLLQALTGMGAGISQPSGELPLFPTWWVLHGCWWYLHMRASPFSRAMGEFRKGVAIALLWLSFLSLGWERGETKLSLSPPCATVPIGFQSSWVIKYWGLLLKAMAELRTGTQKERCDLWHLFTTVKL